jgi:proteasome lid subunit RPN8/RPN11
VELVKGSRLHRIAKTQTLPVNSFHHQAVDRVGEGLRVVGRADDGTIEAIEGAGQRLGAVYHSHTRTAPYPSQTDVNFAANWPGVQWLIVGVAGDEPEVRNYRIDGGVVTEVEVEVDGAG